MANKLTVQQVAAFRKKDKPYKVSVDVGLQMRVATNGVKTWIVQYVVNGKQREFRLPQPWGESTDEGHLSLADARTEAEIIRVLARKGIDYQVKIEEDAKAEAMRLEKERENEARRIALELADNLTFSVLFDDWIPNIDRKDGGAELRRSFGRDILPTIGSKPIKLITDRDIRSLLKAISDRGANRLAVMMLADLKQMFRWAEKNKPWKKLIEDNPAEPIEIKNITSNQYESTERKRALSLIEIKELSVKLHQAGLLKRTEIAMWIMLACCCRIGEIVRARWEHIDLDEGVWIIPKENAKNKLAHTIYLSKFALSYFHQLRELSTDSDWCYPDASNANHVCVKSTTKQIRDRQLTAPGRTPMSNRSKRADALILSGGDWVPHDLRRTGSTMMQPLGVTPQTIERVLNHVEPNKLRRTYQTYDYAKEKREAWRLLGEQLELIVSAHDNVILFPRQA